MSETEFLVRNETNTCWVNKVTSENYNKIIQIKKWVKNDKGYSMLDIQNIIPSDKNLKLFLTK